MTRLERLIRGDSRDVWYPEDVARLQREIPELAALSSSFVHFIYTTWSEDFYSASWMHLDDDTIAHFAEYLRTEVEE